MPPTIIVIPCFNEAHRLDAARFCAFAREHRRLRFLFVNDGSTDGTGEVLEELVDRAPECFGLCDLAENAGKGEAVRQGLLRAYESEPEYLGYWDADLATPLEAILTFCAVLDSRPDMEMVFGARVSLLGRSVERNVVRHYLGRVFATASSLALGIGFYDTQCGAKLFRASHEVMSVFQTAFHTRWLFDVEMVARLSALRRDTERRGVEEIVYEYPLHEWQDVAGSKVKPRDFVRAAAELAAIAWRYRRPAPPSLRPTPSPRAETLRRAAVPAAAQGVR